MEKDGFTLAEGTTHIDTCRKTRKRAFTLAEVLITLSIIGVVAALTIPTLINNYQKRVFVTKLRQTYSQLANAAKLLMADEGVDNLNDTYLNIGNPWADEDFDQEADLSGLVENSAGRFLKKYFRVVEDCGYENASNCYAKSYENLDGSVAPISVWSHKYCVLLNTGSTVCLYPFIEDNCPLAVRIDLNGKAKPNIVGRDVFDFDINYRGEIAESFSPDNKWGIEMHKPDICGYDSNPNYAGGCFNKIIADGWKMDY